MTRSELNTLYNALDACMTADCPALRKRLHGLRRVLQTGCEPGNKLSALKKDIDASRVRAVQRRERLPAVTINEDLPIGSRWRDIAAAIEKHQVVVVAGETGSGKTTQLPKICLALGRGSAGLIGHTQPRRIAARSVATRIAEELNTELGQVVGYKVRFSDHTRPEANIKLMTDGILLAELQGDRVLSQYDTLIIDEAHERSLNIDFLLGYFKRLLHKRPDFKLIITSATIDTGRFAAHFNHAPVIEVSGRSYPVEIRYRPRQGDEDERDRDQQQAILDAVDEVAAIDHRGDILIFLSGEREIRDTAEALRKHHPAHTEILPLYSRLSATEQNRVFKTSARRRIILATNVAETSLTVPGIRYVIDPGTARISRYSTRSKVQRLPIEKIAQSSANQRAGRCGRVAAGVCIRLYSEEDFLARREFTEPELRRTNLASVILQMHQLGLGNPEEFPFIDPPDQRFIHDGYRLLHELGALDEHNQLTPLGRQLARLPLDPRIGRMILEAGKQGCLSEVLVIASALSIQDPRERPQEKQQQADEQHRRFADEHSDFVSLLNLWRHFEEQRKHLSGSQLRKYCRKSFLAFMRMREWRETWQQLKTQARDMGLSMNSEPADYAVLHRALLTGLLGNLGHRLEEEDNKPATVKGRTSRPRKGPQKYQGARNSVFYLFPGSAVAKKRPKWMMAAEVVETSRLYARGIARIEAEWIEPLARHLVKRSYTEPCWDVRRSQVTALETVTLYGLLIQSGKRVHFGPIDTPVAREIFIREALIAGNYRPINRRGEKGDTPEFMRHNQALIREAEDIEARGRRRDVLADEAQLFAFFEQCLPEHIYSGPLFEKWRKQAETGEPDLLKLPRELVIHPERAGLGDRDYPGEIEVNGVRLHLRYGFNPGGEDDGVSALVPLGALNQLDPEPFEWLVPGLLAERVTALLKGLPKPIRKALVPVPDTAASLVRRLSDERPAGSLLVALERLLMQHCDVDVATDAWPVVALPDHLRMRYEVIDAGGRVIGHGRDLSVLQAKFSEHASDDFVQTLDKHHWERSDIRRWDFGNLPPFVEIERAGSRFRAFPALAVQGDGSLSIELFDAEARAVEAHRMGLRALVILTLPKPCKYLRRNLPGIDRLCLQYVGIDDCETLKDDLQALIIDRCFFPAGHDVRSQSDFEHVIDVQQPELMTVAGTVGQLVSDIIALHHAVQKRLRGQLPIQAMDAVKDVQQQLATLVYPGCLIHIPFEWLQHVPRFLRAVEQRIEKLQQTPAADKERMARLKPFIAVYQQKLERKKKVEPALIQLRWLLEEYRVSVFAQSLKTSQPISPKRLEEVISQL
ncbi:MAG: ATP-dependent RNA helicase HrpA [Gammaproteobacteria bacterium]|nr:ATP-dependent RNA helicase HrpA [Gammaproteobacteria bacterium]